MFTSLQRIYPKESLAIHLPLSLGLHSDRLEVGVFSPDFDKNKLSRMMVKMVVKLTSELRLDIVLLL